MTKRQKRPIRIEGDVAYVPLTKGYEVVIDVEDVPLVEGYNWSALVCPRMVYAVRMVASQGKQQAVLLHRILMGDPPGLLIDHADCNGLNCRRHNMRTSTRSQNAQNQRISFDNTSGAKGVSWHHGRQKWGARIMVNRKETWLGSFKCRTAAAVAYMKASRIHHGDFGRTAYGQGQQSTGGARSVQDGLGGGTIQSA